MAGYFMSFYIFAMLFEGILSHGRMNDLPGRSSLWREFPNAPKNYNDMEVYCGGLTNLWDVNGGRCGVCGDPYQSPIPRDNEAGGKYGRGIIVRTYQRGQALKAKIQLTANHGGYFEFRICPTNSNFIRATEQCMNQYVLRTNQGYTYPVNKNNDNYEIDVYLPQTLVCSQCVFRWKYIAAQNIGYGNKQEHFYSCADISINGGGVVTYSPPITQRRTTPYVPPITQRRTTPYVPPPITQRRTTPYVPPITQRRTTPYVPHTQRPYPIDNRKPCENICIFYCRIEQNCPALCRNCRLPRR
ncbi:hypothetical protein LOTGIDRAFT_234127 [Lottia gigantea]|uniref:Chitin-binding type-4 domain-containing protein n=1 Tax=Lottia gigantea TaxID=225164 RepID=V4A407_LOTGI|nr:hypothetical protein LOTGIDRAFT_234127 [Lottia gigantea]ESO89725.1 hypothetical protein LOTGIDRAFT_234127 [Lottia gigantea]